MNMYKLSQLPATDKAELLRQIHEHVPRWRTGTLRQVLNTMLSRSGIDLRNGTAQIRPRNMHTLVATIAAAINKVPADTVQWHVDAFLASPEKIEYVDDALKTLSIPTQGTITFNQLASLATWLKISQDTTGETRH